MSHSIYVQQEGYCMEVSIVQSADTLMPECFVIWTPLHATVFYSMGKTRKMDKEGYTEL